MPESEQGKRGPKYKHGDEPAVQTIVYVPKSRREQADALAKKAKLSRSEWINEAIQEKLDRTPSEPAF